MMSSRNGPPVSTFMRESTGKLAGGQLPRSTSLSFMKLLLKPVLKFGLRHSLKLQEIIEACKSVLIELSVVELENADQSVTVNKLSIMTGVHRPDVMRLHGHVASTRSPENAISRLIGQWQSAPKAGARLPLA